MISSSKLLKAIRHYCLLCSGEQVNEVLNCPMKDCPLYSYRLGLNAQQKKGEKSK